MSAVINKRFLTSFAFIAVLLVVTVTSAETWACTTTSVQKGSFSLGSMSNQALHVESAAPGDAKEDFPGQFTVKNTGTLSGAVYASMDTSSIYVTTKNGKKTIKLNATPMGKWLTIYISDINGKYMPIYVNGKAVKPILISGKKLLAKGKSFHPDMKYTFSDDGKADQNTYQGATFHYNVNFDMKPSIL